MKRVIGTLAVFLMIFSLLLPQSVQAASKVKVKYKGVTRSYSKKKTCVYINGKKVDLSTAPIFVKSGAYMGPLSRVFTGSELNVQYKKSGKKITLTYNGHKLTLKDGTTKAIVDGKTVKKALSSSPMKSAKYANNRSSNWIVPLKSVCARLGLNYQMKDGTIYISRSRAAAPKAGTTVQKPAAQPAAQPALPPTGPVVLVLDAGHGGVDSGARGNSLLEKNMTLAIVLGAKQYFDKDSRFKVLYTRVMDTYPSLDDRCKLANNNNAELFICVHINSASAKATGTETLYNNSRVDKTRRFNIDSKDLALAMQRVARNSTGFPDRKLVNRTGLRVLNKTNMPACLIEYGFISNKTEARLMNSNTARYGRELYQGIVNYLVAKGRIK